MHRLPDILRDLAKALGIGAAGAAVIALILFVIGFAAGGTGALSGLEAAKDGLLLVGAVGLFVLAGMLLVKGKKPEKFAAGNGWRRHFKAVGIKSVIGAVCVAVIIVASIVDYIMFLL